MEEPFEDMLSTVRAEQCRSHYCERMTIPRQIGPETGVRTALPDYRRSNATVERMVSDLRRGPGARQPGARTSARTIRALFPRAATRDTLLRSVAAAVLLGAAVVAVVGIAVLALDVPDGHSPGIGILAVMLALAGLALVLLLLGLRFGIVALGTARSRVEITEQGLRVVGALRTRTAAWQDILAIESRVVHPVHWLTAALRLRDGSRIVMPAFDRHVWTFSQPSGQDIRALRTELHQREKTARARF